MLFPIFTCSGHTTQAQSQSPLRAHGRLCTLICVFLQLQLVVGLRVIPVAHITLGFRTCPDLLRSARVLPGAIAQPFHARSQRRELSPAVLESHSHVTTGNTTPVVITGWDRLRVESELAHVRPELRLPVLAAWADFDALPNLYTNRKLNIACTRLFSDRDAEGCPTCYHLVAKEMVLNGFRQPGLQFGPDIQTLTAAMLNCKAVEQHLSVLEIFDAAVKLQASDRLMYGIAISSCMVVFTDTRRANELFTQCNEDFKLGASPKYRSEDVNIFAAVMFAYEKVGEWDKVLQVYHSMKLIPVLRPTPGIINAALRASMKVADWKIFDEIAQTVAIFNQTTITPRALDTTATGDEENAVTIAKTLQECSELLANAMTGLDVSSAISNISADSPNGGDKSFIDHLIEQLVVVEKDRFRVDNPRLRRRVVRLIANLKAGPSIIDSRAIEPNLLIYGSLIQAAGLRTNAPVAMSLFQDCVAKRFIPDYRLHRALIEACVAANDTKLTQQSKGLLAAFSQSHDFSSNPEAFFFNTKIRENVYVRNGLGLHSSSTMKLIKTVKANSQYRINVASLPEQGHNIPLLKAKEMISLHCEKQALMGSFLANGKFTDAITVNLCLCDDCHSFFKFVSSSFGVTLTCKDPSTIHTFTQGRCSCNEHWGGR